MMKARISIAVAVSAASLGLVAATAQQRDYDAEYEEAIAAAKSAAGFEWLGTFSRLCVQPPTRGPLSTSNEPSDYVTDPSQQRPRETWIADAVQVFDDLYWLGSQLHSAWLITDPEGYILIDTEYVYNSGELILDAMARFKLDPKDIRYIIISHAHGDHIGGVELVQDATLDEDGNQAIVVMGEGDWEMVDTYPGRYQTMTPDPDPSLRVSVPQLGSLETTVGSHTVTSYSTPPHSPGTISHLFTVQDYGRPLAVSYSGGTAYNFQTDEVEIGMEGLQTYLDSVEMMAELSAEAGATVLLSNHNEFDRAWDRSRMMASRGYGQHPFELGAEWVQRYYDVMANCTKAKMIRLEQSSSM
jgi:metallo-beta-lactamase class B